MIRFFYIYMWAKTAFGTQIADISLTAEAGGKDPYWPDYGDSGTAFRRDHCQRHLPLVMDLRSIRTALAFDCNFFQQRKYLTLPMSTLREQIRDQKYPGGFMKPIFPEVNTRQKSQPRFQNTTRCEWGKILQFPSRHEPAQPIPLESRAKILTFPLYPVAS